MCLFRGDGHLRLQHPTASATRREVLVGLLQTRLRVPEHGQATLDGQASPRASKEIVSQRETLMVAVPRGF